MSAGAGTLQRFVGEICGVGTSSGHRLVVGRWEESPFGAFADVMHAAPDGRRTLLAPTGQIGDDVSATYNFDRVVVLPVEATRTPGLLVVRVGSDSDDAPARLAVDVTIGSRSRLGWVLRAVPRPVARSRHWVQAVDPVARRVMPGVRTHGSAGSGRHEWYAATDLHRVVGVEATLDGEPLGELRDVWPPVGFGFASTPRQPLICAVTTLIRVWALHHDDGGADLGEGPHEGSVEVGLALAAA